MDAPPENTGDRRVRIAAAGDMHCRARDRDEVVRTFAALRGAVDLVLLAGDLTNLGRPEQAAVLAEACAGIEVPVYAVLGNHDWHVDRRDELVEVLEAGRIRVLERESVSCEAGGVEVGIVGLKGFVGGFPGSHLVDFGEPLMRTLYRETTVDVEALDRGLREIAACPIRIVLMHYAPTAATIAGEPEGIWAFLGSDRLAAPIAEHEPDVVLHGHAHAGTFEGAIGEVPVYNVSVPVMARDFWLFELEARSAGGTSIY
jgi:Icc-related predicted phosphoesterase